MPFFIPAPTITVVVLFDTDYFFRLKGTIWSRIEYAASRKPSVHSY